MYTNNKQTTANLANQLQVEDRLRKRWIWIFAGVALLLLLLNILLLRTLCSNNWYVSWLQPTKLCPSAERASGKGSITGLEIAGETIGLNNLSPDVKKLLIQLTTTPASPGPEGPAGKNGNNGATGAAGSSGTGIGSAQNGVSLSGTVLELGGTPLLHNTTITNPGNYSFALGNGVTASGVGSVVIGFGSTASGQGSVALGTSTTSSGDYSAAFGLNTAASGTLATAFGDSTEASGQAAVAFGSASIASGTVATAFGDGSTASGLSSTAFGSDTTASGDYSTAFGASILSDTTTCSDNGKPNLEALGFASTAFGVCNVASGQYSTAFGYGTIVTAPASYGVAFGYLTSATNLNSTAFGRLATAGGISATAFGAGSTASGDYATAFGSTTLATGYTSTAFGYGTTASGDFTVAFGSGSIASDAYATAFGLDTTASGQRATAFGEGTTASGSNTTAFGRAVTVSGTQSVGIGLDSTPRTVSQSNTFAVVGGRTGLGLVNPSMRLEVTDTTTNNVAKFNGTGVNQCTVVAGTGWSCSSDETLKTNILSISNGLGVITQLQGVTYNWKSDPNGTRQDGFIAQDIQKILPELVTTDSNGKLSLNKDGIMPFIVEAIKEQNGNLDKTNQQLSDQGIKLTSLSDDLLALTKRVDQHDVDIQELKSQNAKQAQVNADLQQRLNKLEQSLNLGSPTP
ncbi:MAG: tail fiber domain-containing protein [Candidatus Saccharibacteria bacterium]